MRFAQWLEEKKKSSRESIPTTVVSSPLRGQNQDQTGFGVKHDVADYTISDETVPDSWDDNSPAKRIATVKKLIKPDQRYGAVAMPHEKIKEAIVNELVSGVGDIRSTPVNINSTPRSKSANAPTSSSKLQHSADKRRIALDKQAQQQKDQQEKQRIQQEKQRHQQAAKRVVQSQVQQNKSVQ
jgi:hypothetical protein